MIIKSDNGKPPLYYLFMHRWLQFGNDEFWARLPSAFFGTAMCIAAALLGSCLLGKKGWIVGLLLALSPFHIWYSQEARQYAMLGMWGAFAILFHARFCKEKKIVDMVLFIIFGILTCYTFPYGFFFLLVTAICAALYRPSLTFRQLSLDAGAHIFIFASFIPWISHMVKSAMTTSQPHKGRDIEVLAYSFNNLFFGSSIGIPPERLHQTIPLMHDYPVGGLVLLLSVVISAMVALTGLGILWRENWNAFVFCCAGLIIFLSAPFAISLIKTSITNNPRYGFLALLPAMILVAVLLLKVVERPTKFTGILAGLLVIGVATSLFNHYFVDAYSRDNMRAAAQVAEQDKNIDVIFVCSNPLLRTLKYYYHGPAQIYDIAYPRDAVEADEIQLVKSLAPDARHPALFYLRPDLGDPNHKLPPLFESLFRLTGSQKWTGVTLYQYEALPVPSSTP